VSIGSGRVLKASTDRYEKIRGAGDIDTTLLLEELKHRYRHSLSPVDVSFRSLVEWVRTGDQFTHQIHPYPAKLLPHIANFFIRASSIRKGDQQVLDPFCGSGTVALEASLAGAQPLIADANPFALLLTKVKTTPYDPEALLRAAEILRKRITRLRTAPEVPVVNEELWYDPKTKKSLEIILRAVMELEDDCIRDFFRICFSVVARRLSFADPSISVPVRLKQKPSLSNKANEAISAQIRWLENATPSTEFFRVVQSNIERVLSANRLSPKRSAAIPVGMDARKLELTDGRRLPNNSVNLTITSPPYGSAQKYVRASSLSLNWLSLCDPNQLANLEGLSIGREHLSAKRRSSGEAFSGSSRFHKLLENIRKKNPSRSIITETYLTEMTAALRELHRVTAVDGHVVIVIGNNTVTGLHLENDRYITEVMEDLGFELELALADRIHSRGLMTVRNKNAGLISAETILMLRKRAA